jgi:hypothetical protein
VRKYPIWVYGELNDDVGTKYGTYTFNIVVLSDEYYITEENIAPVFKKSL